MSVKRSRRLWGEDSTVCIDLSEGASVTMQFKGNLFDLTAEERLLIANLTNVIQLYRNAEANGNPALEKEGAAL